MCGKLVELAYQYRTAQEQMLDLQVMIASHSTTLRIRDIWNL